jgi:hypothetical protein
MSPNEASLVGAFGGAALGAILGAAVSFFVARNAIKHGPNYGSQIEGLQESVGALATTQEELRKQQAEQARLETERYEAREKKAEAQRWKPTSTIVSQTEGLGQVNYPHLTSSVEFAVIEVSLLTPSGGKIEDYRTGGSKLTSKGFKIQLTHGSLVNLMNVSDSYFQRSTFEGSIRFRVLRDALETERIIPFHAVMVTVGNGLFPKLSG